MRLLAVLVSATAYALAFPPTALRPLAWVALVPLLVALWRAPSLARALGLAWLWTVAAAYGVGDWFPRAIARYYAQPLAVGFGFFFGVSTLMAAVYYMAFAAAYRGLVRRWRVALPLLAAAAWVAAELGRARLFSGNPWALAGYSQAGFAPLVQIADVTGVYGVSFVVVAVNAALAEVLLGTRGPAGAWRPALAGLFLALGATGAAFAYGTLRLATAPPGAGERRVAVVQGNLDMGSQWVPELYGQNLDVYLRLTREALAGGPVDLVVWPESAMTFFLDQEPLFQRAIATALAGTELLAGGPRAADPVRPVYYNSAFLLRGDAIVARYDKERLLPFAEYFPVRALDFVRRRFGRVREFAAGPPGAAPLPSAVGPAGVLICNEVMFPEVAAARVRAGATLLVNLANDAWIGEPRFAAMTFDMARVRAVEQRRVVVRASTSGPSGVVDSMGRVVVETAEGVATVVPGAVSPRDGVTPYAHLGDVFGFGCLLAAAGALVRHDARSLDPRSSVG